MAGQFPVGRYGTGPFFPPFAGGRISRYRPERLDGPLGLLVADLLPEFVAALVGCSGEAVEIGLVGGVIDGRGPVGVAVADRVEADGFADAVVDDVGQLPGVGRAAGW